MTYPPPLAPPRAPPPFVHLSSLEVDLDQSEACLVHSVKWSGIRMVRFVMQVHPSKSKFQNSGMAVGPSWITLV